MSNITSPYFDDTWEVVRDEPNESHTDRLPVPGGWLYRTVIYGEGEYPASVAVSTAFVPKVDVAEALRSLASAVREIGPTGVTHCANCCPDVNR